MSAEMTAIEIEEIHARIGKLMAKTEKLNKETFWYPIAMAGGFFVAATTFVIAIQKFI